MSPSRRNKLALKVSASVTVAAAVQITAAVTLLDFLIKFNFPRGLAIGAVCVLLAESLGITIWAAIAYARARMDHGMMKEMEGRKC